MRTLTTSKGEASTCGAMAQGTAGEAAVSRERQCRAGVLAPLRAPLTCATMPLLAPAQKRCHSRGSAFAPHTAARAAGYSPTPTPAISDVRPSAGTTPR